MDTRISLHGIAASSAVARPGDAVAAAPIAPATDAAGVAAAPAAAAVDAATLARDLQLGVKPSERALAQLNDFLKSQQQQLEFSMDKATRRICCVSSTPARARSSGRCRARTGCIWRRHWPAAAAAGR